MKIYSVDYIKSLLEKAGYKNIRIETLEEKNWLCVIGEKQDKLFHIIQNIKKQC